LSNDSWKSAYKLTKNVDEDDTPFVALAIEIDAILWTGDTKLINGISKKGAEFTKSTSQLIEMLK
jgi:predicted nucleic acid-binding protein